MVGPSALVGGLASWASGTWVAGPTRKGAGLRREGWSWAARGRAEGKGRGGGLGRFSGRWAEQRGGKAGPVWAVGPRCAGLRLWGFGLLFYFFFSSISNSNQLFEFKQNFEFHNLMHTSKINAPA